MKQLGGKWSCTVRLVAREWKEIVYSEDSMEMSALNTFGGIGLIARAAEEAGVAIKRIEYGSGPIYQAADGDASPWYGYRFFVFDAEGGKNEWELRCRRENP